MSESLRYLAIRTVECWPLWQVCLLFVITVNTIYNILVDYRHFVDCVDAESPCHLFYVTIEYHALATRGIASCVYNVAVHMLAILSNSGP
jgi:hypothetical protein